MKYLTLLLLFAVAVFGARTDPATGLQFPDQAGPWVYAGFRSYEPAALGCSYSYKPVLGGKGAITCYVYDKGLPKIPSGADSEIVEQEIKEVFATVALAWTNQKAKVEELTPPTKIAFKKDSAALGYFSLHAIQHEGVDNLSITALGGYQGSFLKVRFTYPGRDADAAMRHFLLFVNALLEANRSELEQVFGPISYP